MPSPDDRLQIATNRGSDDAYTVPDFTDAANTWIGDWIRVVDWERVVGTLASDQASTASGLIVQQTNDKTNVEDSSTFTNDGSAVTEIDVKVTCSWLRIRFQHAGVAPTAFRYHIFGSAALIDDVTVNVALSGDTEVVQPTHDDLNANANLQVADTDVPGGAGNVTAATPRVVIATDDVNSAAIKTATEATQAAVEGSVTVDQSTHDLLNVNANMQVADGDVDVGAGNAGANTQRVSVSTDDVNLAAIKTALEIIDNLVVSEDVAHSDGESGLMPYSVRQDVLAALAGTSGDRQPLSTNSVGALYTATDHRGVLSVSGTQATATSTQIIAAPGANKAILVVGAMLQQNGATPTAQLVAIEDGTAGTEKANFRLSDNDGAGASLAFPVIIATNEALKLDSDQAQSFAYTISYRIIDV